MVVCLVIGDACAQFYLSLQKGCCSSNEFTLAMSVKLGRVSQTDLSLVRGMIHTQVLHEFT
jgi:hypothetical protein